MVLSLVLGVAGVALLALALWAYIDAPDVAGKPFVVGVLAVGGAALLLTCGWSYRQHERAECRGRGGTYVETRHADNATSFSCVVPPGR